MIFVCDVICCKLTLKLIKSCNFEQLDWSNFHVRRFRSTWKKIKIIMDMDSLLVKGSIGQKLLRKSDKIFQV